MEQKRNYDRQMRELTETLRRENRVPGLLLHACCAPCSSACLERVWQDFEVTVFYFNPNIDDGSEYAKRLAEEHRLIAEFNSRIETGSRGPLVTDGESSPHRIGIIDGDYDAEVFHNAVKGLENEPEGGARCSVCFGLRLEETARVAAKEGYEYITTTLTLSPLKDADRLNAIGAAAAERYGVRWLPSDFKKREGYKRSIELSREFDLYRQNYCGCSFSKQG